MYFNYSGGIDGGHDAVATATLATSQYFAEGYTGRGFTEYLSILNPSGNDAVSVITYYTEDIGTVTTAPRILRPNSGITVNVNDEIGAGHSVSVQIQVNNEVPILAEGPMYFSF